MQKQTNLIAVYGSLLSGLHNNYILENSKLLGSFKSKPEFSLYSLGGFPGLKTGGNTKVLMEIYEVNEETAQRIDRLEGYTPGGNNTFYDKIPIGTPYGEASVYIYVNDIPKERLVESGDWKAFKQSYFTPRMN
jgi:gamma-glutamylcyclotransferase (GGCT)/AIG2-like uncharacterized protein YtfP